MSQDAVKRHWRANGARVGFLVGSGFVVLEALAANGRDQAFLLLPAPGRGMPIGIPIMLAAISGGWLLGPLAAVADRRREWLAIVLALACWAVVAGAVSIGVISTAAFALADKEAVLAAVVSGAFLGLVLGLLGTVLFGLIALPYTLAGALLWAALMRRGIPGSVSIRAAAWIASVAVLRPEPVDALFLAIVFVAVPVGLEVLRDLGVGEDTRNIVQRLVGMAQLGTFPSAVSLAASLEMGAGPLATILAVPWVIVAGLLGLAALVDRHARGLRLDSALIPEAAMGFAAVGGLLVLDHRLGADPFGFSQFLVLLAAIHFHVAGFVLLTAVAALARWRGGVAPLVAGGLAIVGGPLTAIGFFGLPGVNIAGAAFTVSGGLLVGLLHLGVARSLGIRLAALLLGLAGGSLLITMPMAAAWAVGLLMDVELLPLDAMTRIHGGLNALGFGLAAMLGWRLALRPGGDRR